VPTFCRHNRLIQNCLICSREQEVEPRPLVSSGTPGSPMRRSAREKPPRTAQRSAPGRPKPSAPPGLRIRRLARGADDGYQSPLVPGLRSSEDALRLAGELAFAGTRLRRLDHDPPGLYGEVASTELEIEERTWLALLIAYLSPLEESDPFAEVKRVRTAWSSGQLPELSDVRVGPRSAHDPARGAQTLEAYRVWAKRAGSQGAGLAGDPGWSAERRFSRAFERLALPGFHRAARFEFLTTLGALGVLDLSAGGLQLGGSDTVTVAAKRVLGIGDPLLLERRAAQLAQECALPLAALDLALYNWEADQRASAGINENDGPDSDIFEGTIAALAL
jgi:hypothetical protein